MRGPFGQPVRARLGRLDDGVFLVEAAEAVGHARLRAGERNPRRATSAGVGDLLLAALDRGAERVLVALGGTVTVDGGLGLLGALGALPDGLTGASLLDDPDPQRAVARPAARARRARRAARCRRAALRRRTAPHACSARRRVCGGATSQVFDAALERLGRRLGGDLAQRPGRRCGRRARCRALLARRARASRARTRSPRLVGPRRGARRRDALPDGRGCGRSAERARQDGRRRSRRPAPGPACRASCSVGGSTPTGGAARGCSARACSRSARPGGPWRRRSRRRPPISSGSREELRAMRPWRDVRVIFVLAVLADRRGDRAADPSRSRRRRRARGR